MSLCHIATLTSVPCNFVARCHALPRCHAVQATLMLWLAQVLDLLLCQRNVWVALHPERGEAFPYGNIIAACLLPGPAGWYNVIHRGMQGHPTARAPMYRPHLSGLLRHIQRAFAQVSPLYRAHGKVTPAPMSLKPHSWRCPFVPSHSAYFIYLRKAQAKYHSRDLDEVPPTPV